MTAFLLNLLFTAVYVGLASLCPSQTIICILERGSCIFLKYFTKNNKSIIFPSGYVDLTQ